MRIFHQIRLRFSKLTLFTATISVLAICSSCTPEIRVIPAEPEIIPLDPEAMMDAGKGLYPPMRQWVFPLNGSQAPTLQPICMWPLHERYHKNPPHIRYQVQWSQDPSFQSDVIESAQAFWALAMPEAPLHEGTWHWRVRSEVDGSVSWSDTYTFTIENDTPESSFPHYSTLIERLSEERPRAIIRKHQIENFRELIRGRPLKKDILIRAEARLQETFPKLIEPTQSELEGLTSSQKRKARHTAVKMYGREARWFIADLLYAWILSGDLRYANAAIEHAIELSKLPHEGLTFAFKNHFGNAEIMLTMALVLDSCWDQIEADERKQLAEAAAVRAEGFVQSEWASNLELRTREAHPWQRLLLYVAETAICLQGVIPEADSWLAYVYELWTARGPYVGGWDGGWAFGYNYLEYNGPSLIGFPHLIEQCFGIRLYSHPFYQNVARYATMFPWNPGFGDGDDNMVEDMHPLLYGLSHLQSDAPYLRFYLNGYKPPQTIAIKSGDYPDYAWIFAIKELDRAGTKTDISDFEIENAAAFSGVGHAVLHSNRASLDNNLAVSFISSPFGGMGHAQREQNSFNVAYSGEPLFYRTGYRIEVRDPHHKGWYVATDSKNSILIDGKGQVESHNAFGQLLKFGNSEAIAYISGDAASAYNPPMGESLAEFIKELGLIVSGEAGVTKFRRHLALLRPHTVLVYDELEARQDSEWELRLQSSHPMLTDENQLISISGDKASASALVIGSSELDDSISNDIVPPPINWRGKLDKATGEPLVYTPHYFGAWKSPMSQTQRYLTVIQVNPHGEEIQTPELKGKSIVSGGWTISAVLDTEQPAGFSATNGESGISMNHPLQIGDNSYPLSVDTVIYESEGEVLKCEELPLKRIGNGIW